MPEPDSGLKTLHVPLKDEPQITRSGEAVCEADDEVSAGKHQGVAQD